MRHSENSVCYSVYMHTMWLHLYIHVEPVQSITGILDIQAAEAASVYTHGPGPGQQQASIFAASMRHRNIQIKLWQYSRISIPYCQTGTNGASHHSFLWLWALIISSLSLGEILLIKFETTSTSRTSWKWILSYLNRASLANAPWYSAVHNTYYPFSNGIFSHDYGSGVAFLGNSMMAETAYSLSSCPSAHN